jgi:hypothetical protein
MRLWTTARVPAARPNITPTTVGGPARFYRTGRTALNPYCLAGTSRARKLQEVVLRFLRPALVAPTMMEIEQAHLMDAASAALFDALAPDLAASAWVVLASRRDTVGGMVLASEQRVRVELGPLPREATRALAVATPEAAPAAPTRH